MSSSSENFENTFSWSSNRSHLFKECKRKYYFNYYGYWGGWNSDCDERVQDIYLLKKLQNRHMWLGTLVHDSIERVLKYLRADRLLEEQEVVDQMVKRMREEFVDSRNGKYRLDPKGTPGLTEHEYGEDIEDDEWVRLREKGITCIRNFFSSDTFEQIHKSDVKEWLAIEGDLQEQESMADSFEMGDLTVWLKLDAAYRSSDGTVHIVDWKTGKGDPNFRQLYCYGYYAWKKWDVDPSNLLLTYEKLASREQHQEEFSFEQLESLEDEVRDEALQMKEMLVDPEENEAREEDFPMVDQLNLCRNCRFRRICYPDGIPDSD